MNPLIQLWENRSRVLANIGSIFVGFLKEGISRTKATSSLGGQIQQEFPHLMREINAMEKISS
jgi:hypothetical protein